MPVQDLDSAAHLFRAQPGQQGLFGKAGGEGLVAVILAQVMLQDVFEALEAAVGCKLAQRTLTKRSGSIVSPN